MGWETSDILNTGVTTAAAATSFRAFEPPSASREVQKVVIVNGSYEILDLLETMLAATRYDMVFVESSAHAYSQIKRVQTNSVILGITIEDL